MNSRCVVVVVFAKRAKMACVVAFSSSERRCGYNENNEYEKTSKINEKKLLFAQGDTMAFN